MRSFLEPGICGDDRNDPRISATLPVRYGVGPLIHTAVAENISSSGLYLQTNEVFKVGSRFQLLIEFPDRVFGHTCEVMWAIRVPEHLRESLVHGMGVHFVDTCADWHRYYARWKEQRVVAGQAGVVSDGTSSAGTQPCRLCRHYRITWDLRAPYGCKALDFKSSRQPSLVVRESSGLPCQLFRTRCTAADDSPQGTQA